MAVNIKMGVDIGNFTAGIKEGQQILKGLNAEMKASEAEFKATGNAEQKMSSQTKTLNSQLNVQKGIADQAKQALEAMANNGVKPTDAAYQKLYVTMMNAEAGMNEAQAALNSMGEGAVAAAGGVDKLQSGLNGISKKISLDQVINGIGKITSGLETAAKKAISLGESIFDNIMDAAKWADDSATMAMMYGIDLDQYLKMQKLVTNGMDTSVEAILKAQSKLKKGVGDDTKATIDALKELGVGLRSGNILDPYSWQTKNPTEMFWDAGKALMALGDEYEQEAKAQAIFGRSWKELVPLFKDYSSQEDFQTALDNVNVESEESVNNLAKLNDTMGALRGNLDTVSREILAQFAPGLTELAGSLSGLLDEVLKYLKTEDGKAMLESMKESFLGLFDGLKDVSAESVVSGFKSVFESIVGGFKWIKDNGNTLLGILEGIGIFWAGLKVSEGALTLLKLVNGLQGLLGAGSATGGAGITGGLVTGLGAKLTAGAGNVAGLLGNAVLQNSVPAIGDWIMNSTDIGMWFKGTKTPGESWKEFTDNLQHNADTFADNWNPDSENANVIAKLVGEIADTYVKNAENTLNFWKNQHKTLTEAQEWNLGEDATIEDSLNFVMQQMHPEVEVQPTIPADTAAQIAEEIGVVNVPIAFVEVTGDPVYTKRTPKRNGIPGHANGLSFVPYDGYLALLHKGESVVPARQMTSRNFTSNMYIENMNMNGGVDADGLAARVAAENRRIMSGYGSN